MGNMEFEPFVLQIADAQKLTPYTPVAGIMNMRRATMTSVPSQP